MRICKRPCCVLWISQSWHYSGARRPWRSSGNTAFCAYPLASSLLATMLMWPQSRPLVTPLPFRRPRQAMFVCFLRSPGLFVHLWGLSPLGRRRKISGWGSTALEFRAGGRGKAFSISFFYNHNHNLPISKEIKWVLENRGGGGNPEYGL